jgi:hypothetical protein
MHAAFTEKNNNNNDNIPGTDMAQLLQWMHNTTDWTVQGVAVRFPTKPRDCILHPSVQTGSGAHSASYLTRTKVQGPTQHPI